MTNLLAWSILVLGFTLAAVGSIFPGLPGIFFAVVGVVIYKYLVPDAISWISVGIILALAMISWLVDFFSGVWGARLGGATRQGAIGAAIGGLVGIFLGFQDCYWAHFLGPYVATFMQNGAIYCSC